MSQFSHCSILLDLRITQIAQRERGIPRYAAALALALPEQLPGADISYLIDPDAPLPDAIEALSQAGRIIEGPAQISSLPHLSHYLQTCFFELHKNADELFPKELAQFKPRLSTIVYDVIPWLYPEHYLTDPYIAERYEYQLGLLNCLDHLFAISESARDDVIRVAQLEPRRVQNIYGSIDEARWARAEASDAQLGNLERLNEEGQRFSIKRPYWLYVGGADFRKNNSSLVRAFAQLKAKLAAQGTEPVSLVVACSLSESQRDELLALGKLHGLEAGQDLIITGFISDSLLAHLYRHAFATVFPSHYEGLGLPVLESYYFGVPALASNNSSLREITHPACQFDSTSDTDIAEAMLRLHNQPELRAESLQFGQAMLVQCSWPQAAAKIAHYVAQFTKSK
jgi:glycosyltransferase involved in cell wall biosynthesis